jgi:hypothetical protein
VAGTTHRADAAPHALLTVPARSLDTEHWTCPSGAVLLRGAASTRRAGRYVEHRFAATGPLNWTCLPTPGRSCRHARPPALR